jgi:putative SOS response-associated peptidase YedK
MCGRFTLAQDVEDVADLMEGLDVEAPLPRRYNIAPSQPVPTVLNRRPLKVTLTQWGLVPGWAKDPEIGNRLINARSETAADKPSFRRALRRRRCLILADGFYEWQKVPGSRTKIPTYVRLRSRRPFAFAGLWEEWLGRDGTELTTSTILTTRPNRLLRPIHDRMPVILPRQAYGAWLHQDEVKPAEVAGLLGPYPADEMEAFAFAVGRSVNNVRHDGPDCIEPAPTLPEQQELL